MKMKFKETRIRKKDFIGIWRITEMSEWDDEYVNKEVPAFIKIERTGMGEFHFGLVQGYISGDFKKNKEGIIFDFTWDGSDECDSANGDGWMRVHVNGMAEGEIRFHAGDTSTFIAKRTKKK